MTESENSSKTLNVGDTLSVDLGSVRGEVVSTNIARDRVGVCLQGDRSFTIPGGGPHVIYFNVADLDWVKVPEPLIDPAVDLVLDSGGRLFSRYGVCWYRESSLTGGFTITESELVNEHGPVTPLYKGEPVKTQGEPDRGSDDLSKARHQTPLISIEEANETFRQNRKEAEALAALEKAVKQAFEKEVPAEATEVCRGSSLNEAHVAALVKATNQVQEAMSRISIEERNAIEQKQQWLNEC